jgi:MFS family permease
MERNAKVASALFQKDFFSVLIVVVFAFSWYFPLYLRFQKVVEHFQLDYTLLFAAFGIQFAAAILFAILGTTLVKRVKDRNTFLIGWMIVGVIASLSLILLEIANTQYILFVSFFVGSSLGVGFPSCLAYFGDHSTVENRGRLAGITFLASGLCILLVGLIVNFQSLISSALILAAWRATGLLLFIIVRPKQDFRKDATDVSYRTVFFDRDFLLYFVPWLMFCLVNFLEAPIVDISLGEDFTSFIPIAEYGIGAFVALIGGWFADSVGRKRVVMLGFIMLGIGYAVLGIFTDYVIAWYLYVLVDGVAWGIFSLMFYLVIWSELAGNRIKEKYCLIGLFPFLISSYMQILFTPYAGNIEISAAFSFASFFLFIAVLPLLYAPETMPEKKIELKRLKSFAEEAQKAKEKYDRKIEK